MTKSLLSQAVNDSCENKKVVQSPCNEPSTRDGVEDNHESSFDEGHVVIGTYGASGIKELEHLLASSVPECTPPSLNLLGSPPKRDMAANPLSHCSSWTRLACMSSQSNLDMLDTVVDEEREGRSIAIPVPQISRCSSGAHWVQTGSISPAGY